jgi:hypothetical protein
MVYPFDFDNIVDFKISKFFSALKYLTDYSFELHDINKEKLPEYNATERYIGIGYDVVKDEQILMGNDYISAVNQKKAYYVNNFNHTDKTDVAYYNKGLVHLHPWIEAWITNFTALMDGNLLSERNLRLFIESYLLTPRNVVVRNHERESKAYLYRIPQVYAFDYVMDLFKCSMSFRNIMKNYVLNVIDNSLYLGVRDELSVKSQLASAISLSTTRISEMNTVISSISIEKAWSCLKKLLLVNLFTGCKLTMDLSPNDFSPTTLLGCMYAHLLPRDGLIMKIHTKSGRLLQDFITEQRML